MRKDDYLCIPQERLAELLVERDEEINALREEIKSMSGAGIFDPSKFYKPNQGPNIYSPIEKDYSGWPPPQYSNCVSSTWEGLRLNNETDVSEKRGCSKALGSNT